jgi:Flp pilus assembly protein TadB
VAVWCGEDRAIRLNGRLHKIASAHQKRFLYLFDRLLSHRFRLRLRDRFHLHISCHFGIRFSYLDTIRALCLSLALVIFVGVHFFILLCVALAFAVTLSTLFCILILLLVESRPDQWRYVSHILW